VEGVSLVAVGLAVFVMGWDWQKTGAIAALIVLAISVWVNFIAPWLRKRRLKKPCKAFFHIRELAKGELSYVLQDDEAHQVKELVLPANALVEIEVTYSPTTPFYVEETVFECAGDYDSKPIVEVPLRPFVAKGEFPKGVSYWNRHGGYHYSSRYGGRAVGSWYVKGFLLRTKAPGTYKAWIGFLTDEVDGDATDLAIKVEEKPLTRMNCVIHSLCKLRPYRANQLASQLKT
jgi:hypothetical protein